MKKARMWTLAVAMGAFGAGDWFLGTLPADEDAAQGVTVGGATVSAAVRPVEENGRKVDHLFLDLRGEGAGTLKVRLMETSGNPMSRMPAFPTTVWEKEIAVDTAKSKSIDLGAAPVAKAYSGTENQVSYDLTASRDGTLFPMVWGTSPALLEVTP